MDDQDRARAVAEYRRLALRDTDTEATPPLTPGHGSTRSATRCPSWPDVYHDDQDVIGFWGLTNHAHAPTHHYRVRGAQLSTRCARDTMFITRVLGIAVSARCRRRRPTGWSRVSNTTGGEPCRDVRCLSGVVARAAECRGGRRGRQS